MKEFNLADNNGMWKGDNVGYGSLHSWVNRNKPKSMFCECCGKITERLDTANISGLYKRDISDFRWLCRKCHKQFDLHKSCRKGHLYTPENTRIDTNGSRRCIKCYEIALKDYTDRNKDKIKKYKKEYAQRPEVRVIRNERQRIKWHQKKNGK